MSNTRILLADDHAVLRAGLRLLIDAQPDLACVGEAADGMATLAQVDALQPDLVLLDLTMPRLSGFDTLAEIRRRCPQVRVLILTMHADDEYCRQCLKSGASGYVLKQAADQELLLAIQAVMRGEVYVHPAMTRALLGDLVDPGSQATAVEHGITLSDREADVLKQVARGYTNQEIATRLSLSIKTIETYRARAMQKVGLTSRAALVRYALGKGWLEEA